MKSTVFLCAAILFSDGLFAQIDLGAKAGLNISNFKSSEILTQEYSINPAATGSLGYHAGAFLRVSLFGVFVQPELIFTSISSEFTVENISTATEQLAKQTIGRVDVPVLLGAKLGNLRIELGPVGSVIISDKSELKKISGYEEKIKSATVGYQLGGGFDIWRFSIDCRYESNLSRLGDHIDTGSGQIKFDSRAKQLIFSLGFMF